MTFSRRLLARMNRGRVTALPGTSGGGPPADTDEPGTTSRVISADGTYMDWTFDEPMDQTSTPAASTMTFAGTSVTTSTPAWQSATVLRVPILGRFLASETVTITYTAGAAPIQDLAGNDHANVSGGSVTNGSGIELETVVDLQLSSGSIADTEYVVGRPISGVPVGAGGGGDGGVTNGASGGGGESGTKTVALALPGGYSWSLGTGGAAGTAGTATAGGNTTWSDSGGVLSTANGGSPGDSVGPTGGAGGTGGSGNDAARAGGSGTGGTGNRAGGGAAGTSTAGSGTAGGEPDGASGPNVDTNTPGRGVGGAVRMGTPLTGRTGGDGQFWLTYQRAIVANAQPRVVATAWGRDTSNTTSRNVTFGDSHVANDRLLVQAEQDGAPGGASMSGYTELLDAGPTGNQASGLVYVRDGNGSDGVALATASERTCWITHRIRGAAAVAGWTLTSAANDLAQLDPPSHDHGSSVDALWFACGGVDITTNNLGVSAFPTNYTGRVAVPTDNLASQGVAIGVCMRHLAATQTENPGAFTSVLSLNGRVWTLCIPKA